MILWDFDIITSLVHTASFKKGDFLTALLFRLIWCIATVVLAVTLPASGDAASWVFTAKLVHATRHLGWRRGKTQAGYLSRADLGWHRESSELKKTRWWPYCSWPVRLSHPRSHCRGRTPTREVCNVWWWHTGTGWAHMWPQLWEGRTDLELLFVFKNIKVKEGWHSTHGSPSHPLLLHSCPGRYSGRCRGCSDSGGNIWTGWAGKREYLQCNDTQRSHVLTALLYKKLMTTNPKRQMEIFTYPSGKEPIFGKLGRWFDKPSVYHNLVDQSDMLLPV